MCPCKAAYPVWLAPARTALQNVHAIDAVSRSRWVQCKQICWLPRRSLGCGVALRRPTRARHPSLGSRRSASNSGCMRALDISLAADRAVVFLHARARRLLNWNARHVIIRQDEMLLAALVYAWTTSTITLKSSSFIFRHILLILNTTPERYCFGGQELSRKIAKLLKK